MVNGQGIIAVHITEESEKQGTAEGPWLAFVIAEILYLVVINKSPTPRDRYADLLIQGPIGQVFSQIHC